MKSYVGEGKTQKQFAVDYLERRSRWKNAKKRGTKYEDDLTTPALAITPGEGEFQVNTVMPKLQQNQCRIVPLVSNEICAHLYA